MSAVPVDLGRGFVRLLHGVRRKTGGEQCRTAINGAVGVACTERLLASARFVQIGQRRRQIAPDDCGQTTVVPGSRVLELLSGGGEQVFGPGVVGGSSA